MSRQPPRREGWPWPASSPPAALEPTDPGAAQGRVHAMAHEVARLAEELRLAVDQLEAAQGDARAIAAIRAAHETELAIAQARRREP